MHRFFHVVSGVILCLATVSACVRLPEYARPHFLPEAENISRENSFAYRQLTLEDFQAKDLPPRYAQYANYIQARSCISLELSPDSQLQIGSGIVSGKIIYTGRFQNISYIATFQPECSWWNPKSLGDRKEYILQHEQVHFAITELTARKLNREYGDYLSQFVAVGNTMAEVREQLRKEAGRLSGKGNTKALAEHTAFDEDTSIAYDQKTQQEWYDRVTRELETFLP